MITERMKKTVTDTEIQKRKSINTIQHHAFTPTTITTTRDHQKTHKPTHARDRQGVQASERKRKRSKEKQKGKKYNKRGKKGGKGEKRRGENKLEQRIPSIIQIIKHTVTTIMSARKPRFFKKTLHMITLKS